MALCAILVATGCHGPSRAATAAAEAEQPAPGHDVGGNTTSARVASEDELAGQLPRVGASGTPEGATRVVVSREEVRVIFPPAADPDGSLVDVERCEGSGGVVRWGWSVAVPEARVGFRSLGVRGSVTCGEPAPESLEGLILGGRAGVAPSGMFLQYEPTPVDAFVQDGSVLLVLRDSTAIVDLFGLRPEAVEASAWGFSGRDGAWTETVPVAYASPPLPPVDSAFLAEARATRLAWEQSIRRTSRRIEAVDSRGARLVAPVWVAVGDSIHLEVREVRCVHDSCRVREIEASGASWSVEDPGVATLGVMEPRPDLRAYALRDVVTLSPTFVRGVAPGRTRVRVEGIPDQADQAPLWMGAPTSLEIEVVVTEQPARIELGPRMSEATLGDQVQFSAVAFDARGGPMEGVIPRFMGAGRMFP